MQTSSHLYFITGFLPVLYICTSCRALVVDVSLPEVSREDLPARVQEFLRRDDEKFESQLQEQNDEQVSFSTVVDM